MRTENRFHQTSVVLLERILSFIPACFNNTARYCFNKVQVTVSLYEK